jgi:Putative prokaryotic signal transducing protein
MTSLPNADPELVPVFDTQQESEAMVIHALLESAGIESIITNLDAPQDVLPGVGGVVVQVNPAKAEEARRVIEDYRNNPAPEEDEPGIA